MNRITLYAIVLLFVFHSQAFAKLPNGTKDGRFQLFQASGSHESIFMIDSQTGKMWVGVSSPEGGTGNIPIALMDMPVEGISFSTQQIRQMFINLKKTSSPVSP